MRSLKRFTVVLAGCMCALALAAGSASALGFVANNDPGAANYTGSGSATLSYNGYSTNCTVTIAGQMSESSKTLAPAGSLIASCGGSTNFSNCRITQFRDGAVDFGPSGCGPITSSTPTSTGDKIYLNESGTATYQNQGSGSTKSISVSFSIGGQYELGAPWKSGLKPGAQLTGQVTLVASRSGVQVPFEARAEALTALGVSAGPPPQFTSARYPVNIHTAMLWKTNPYWYVRGTTIDCSSADYTTTGLSGATSTLSLRPELGGCVYGGLSAAAFRNGCTYQFELTSTAAGTFKVACPEGSSLEFLAYKEASELAEGKYLCKMAIPSQSGTFTLTTVDGALKPNVSISKLKHTQTRNSIFCPAGNGTFEDGSFAQEMKLAGSY
ncbi:MAG TPA: hypothetical protein VNM38_07180 [Solirubrobacterales bacterium]|nr:hypothetical protein [Solirubrobacterales bacterium]